MTKRRGAWHAPCFVCRSSITELRFTADCADFADGLPDQVRNDIMKIIKKKSCHVKEEKDVLCFTSAIAGHASFNFCASPAIPDHHI